MARMTYVLLIYVITTIVMPISPSKGKRIKESSMFESPMRIPARASRVSHIPQIIRKLRLSQHNQTMIATPDARTISTGTAERYVMNDESPTSASFHLHGYTAVYISPHNTPYSANLQYLQLSHRF
jgi:FtsP/CotA-like multicopper oxidase with cupredoxin domain